jgi:hypothetical protein
MIALILVQVFLINKINETKDVITYNTENTKGMTKTFNEINEDLSRLKEKNILSVKRNNKKWVFEIKIQGSKEELGTEISKLQNYDISDYIINRKEGENSVILKISDTESNRGK